MVRCMFLRTAPHIANEFVQAKVAQEKLVELEKAGAPIDDQLEQAGLFAGIEWLDFLQTAVPTPTNETGVKVTNNFHGREEWALRWLIKKLNTAEARVSPIAWRLFRCLVERIPVVSAAKILSERKLLVLLRQALEETVALQKKDGKSEQENTPKKSSSKKRRRTGELVDTKGPITITYDIAESLYEAVDILMRIVGTNDLPEENDASDAAFAKKYMKLVVTTSEDEAARILRAWLRMTVNDLERAKAANQRNWVTPFVGIWNARVITTGADTVAFKSCLKPALTLLSQKAIDIPAEWRAEIEKLVSQFVILPAKTAYGKTRDRDTDILSSFIDELVADKPHLTVSVFDIAIRSTQITTNLRTRTHAINWLQAVFRVLMDAIPDEQQIKKNAALVMMLRSCIEESIPLDLDLLQTLVSKYGFKSEEMDTKLVAAVIDLNPLAFTLSNTGGKELTNELFKRVTELPSAFYLNDEHCVLHILTVLMGAFAKSRDLVAFVHGWYDQLVAVATREDAQVSAWESVILYQKMKEVMEQSLTAEQVSELCLWLVTKSDIEDAGSAPALAIADAVSGAISSNNYVHQVGDSLWRLAADNFTKAVNTRWEHRAWNIMAHCFDVAFPVSTTTRTMLEDVQLKDYYFIEPAKANRGRVSLAVVKLAWFNFAVSYHTFAAEAVVNTAPIVELREPNMGPRISAVLESVLATKRLQKFVTFASSAKETDNASQELSSEAALPSYLEIVLRKYPYMNTLIGPCSHSKEAAETNRQLPNEIFSMFWLASLSPAGSAKNSWIKENKDFFSDLWKSSLLNDNVLNNKILISALIEVILQCGTHEENPIEKSSAPNAFAIESLSILPIEVFSRNHRERILKVWVPTSEDASSESAASLVRKLNPLDTAIISLKMKMMETSSIFENFSEKDLSELAIAISDFSIEPKAPLSAFAEYVKRVQGHLLSTAGQTRSDELTRKHLTFAQFPKHVAKDSKSAPRSGTILYVELILSWWTANEERISKLKLGSKKSSLPAVSQVVQEQKEFLVANLSKLIEKPSMLKTENDKLSMSLCATLEALQKPVFGVQPKELSHLWAQAHYCAKEVRSHAPELASLLVLFFLLHNPDSGPEGVDLSSVWVNAIEDPSTTEGRDTLRRAAHGFLAVSNEGRIRRTVSELIPSCELHLDKLVFLRYLIMGVEGQ